MSELLSKLSARGFNAPILYLPMRNSATCHVNEGTGGNFVLNGTVATSNVGANQQTCRASYFDGTADYLSRTSLTGVADGKQFTLTVNIKGFTAGSNNRIMSFLNSSNGAVFIFSTSDSGITISAYSSGTLIFNVASTSVVKPIKNIFTLSISIDMTDVLKGRLVVNGMATPFTTTHFVNSNVSFSTITQAFIAAYNASLLTAACNIGELYFDTKYIDLTTNNPFWDKDTNKPVPVRKVIANTGVTPLIAMPLDASNAGKNYGTGGDFTANSAPYVGARGASEFWARSVKGNGTSGYLGRTSIGASNSYTFSVTFASKYIGDEEIISFYTDSSNYFQIYTNGGAFTVVSFVGGSAKAIITNISIGGVSMTSNMWYVAQLSFDMRSGTLRNAYVNGNKVTPNYDTYVSSLLPFNTTSVEIGRKDKSLYFNSDLSFIYFTTDYIDFSQESNRLKFVDGLGYPLDLAKQIDAGVIPKPLIYLPFDDPSNLGKNLGTGGNFTVNGTVTSGSDVLG